MNDIHAAEEDVRKVRAEAKHNEEQQTRRDDIGYETRTGGQLTNGKIRRHTSRRDDGVMALLKKPFDSALAIVVADTNLTLESISRAWKAVVHDFLPAARTNTNDPNQYVELREHEDTSYVFATAMVGDKVRAKLESVERDMRTLETQRDRTYATGQFGPIGADYKIHALKAAFDMRVHPVTREYAYGEERVRALQTELGCDGGSCPVTVFRAVATDSLRGIRVNVADLNNDDTVKIAASDEANNKQAATVALRPGMHLRLNG